MDYWTSLYNKYYKLWEHPKVNNEEVPRKEREIEPYVQDTIPEIQEPIPDIQEPIPDIQQPIPDVQETVLEIQEIILIHEPDVVDTVPEPTEVEEPKVVDEEPKIVLEEPKLNLVDPVQVQEEAIIQEINNGTIDEPKVVETVRQPETQHMNGNGIDKKAAPRTSNEIKMVQNANGTPKDVIRANDPPEDDLPKNFGVNNYVSFFESLGGKK